jgi:type IV pilus assembly protein PilN
MRIAINLASRPFADIASSLKKLRIAMGVLALVAICFVLGLRAVHDKAERAREVDHSLDGQIAQIRQERQGYLSLMQQPDNAQTLAQIASLNSLFDEKAFSWTLAIEDLETVLPGGVQVTSLEPARAKDGTITLKLRVIGPRDRAVELVANLEHSRRFVLPRIVGENAESANNPNERAEPVSASNRVDFELLADYNPASAEERKQARARAAANEKSAARRTTKLPSNSQNPTQGRPPYSGMPRPRAPIQPYRGGPPQ